MFKKSRKRLLKESRVGGWASALSRETAVSAQALSTFALDVRGTVVPSSDPAYNADRQLSNNAFQDFPQVIVYCEVIGDVRASLEFARQQNLWITTRSGGHCTAGFSVNTGIVIDTSRMNYTVVDAKKKRAIAGAGTNFGHLNATLDEWALHTPGGGCEDVCLAGHSAGGGYGFTSRQFGLNCDNVVEAMVMLADGRVVVADAKQNTDLFWAIRGGTGNNFGVTLQLTYALHDLRDVWGFGLRWPVEDAAPALHELQKNYTKTGAPNELGYMAFVAYQSGTPYLLMRGVFDGPTADGKKALRSLLKTRGAELQIDKRGSYYRLNNDLLEKPNALPECPDLAREDKRSAIIDRTLSVKEWQSILDAWGRSPNKWSMIVIEPYGGKLGELPLDFNAFVHRKASLDLFCDVFWMDAEGEVAAKGFLDGFFRVVDPHSNGQQYQNYPRRGTQNYGWIYWGEGYDTLREIKRKYDPKNAFHFEQSIVPAKEKRGTRGEPPMVVEPTVARRGAP